jgi:hypothetical protein
MLRHTVCRFAGLCFPVLVLTALAVADDAGSQKYSLRYQFEKDGALHYTVGNESTIDVQVGAESEKVSHSSESGRMLRTVLINPDGSTVLEVLIEYVNLSAADMNWDSRSGEPPPPQFTGIDKTIGTPLMAITVAPSGTVIAAESNGKAADKSQLEAAQFDLFPILPSDPVAVGASWTEPFKVDVLTASQLPKSISLQRTYTLRSVDNGVAEIDVKTAVITPIEDPLEEGQLIQRTPSGTLRLNIAEGRMLERIMKLDNKVVGFQGAQSAMRVTGTRQESLESSEKSAVRPAGQVVK